MKVKHGDCTVELEIDEDTKFFRPYCDICSTEDDRPLHLACVQDDCILLCEPCLKEKGLWENIVVI